SLRWIAPAVALVLASGGAYAGLYFSNENFAELPAQWRGFLIDQRALRTLAVTPADGTATPLRKEYLDAAARLEKTAKERALTADEAADLGAVYVRLG